MGWLTGGEGGEDGEDGAVGAGQRRPLFFPTGFGLFGIFVFLISLRLSVFRPLRLLQHSIQQRQPEHSQRHHPIHGEERGIEPGEIVGPHQ